MGSININYEGKTESHEMEALPEQQGGEGGGVEVIEVTKEEYDSLPDSKYTDGKLYKIKDVNINGDATTVTYVDPDGNKTNVAADLDKVNNNLYIHGEKISNPFNATTNWEAHTNSFVAPSDGWLFLLVGSATDQPCQLSVDGNMVFYDGCTVYPQHTAWRSGCFFIKKGQTAEFKCTGNSYLANSYFLKL